MEEKRTTRRRRCLLGARIVFNDRSSTMFCTVRNISDSGAALEFGAVPLMPKSFELLLDSHAGYSAAKVIWQNLNQVGVAFSHSQLNNGKDGLAVSLLMDAMPIQSRKLH